MWPFRPKPIVEPKQENVGKAILTFIYKNENGGVDSIYKKVLCGYVIETGFGPCYYHVKHVVDDFLKNTPSSVKTEQGCFLNKNSILRVEVEYQDKICTL